MLNINGFKKLGESLWNLFRRMMFLKFLKERFKLAEIRSTHINLQKNSKMKPKLIKTENCYFLPPKRRVLARTLPCSEGISYDNFKRPHTLNQRNSLL